MRTLRTIGFGAAAVLFLLTAAACGGSVEPMGSGASGVASSKRLVDLSDAEKGTLCDWMVGKAGSYGSPGTCDQGTSFLAYVDQADCIDDSPDTTFTECQATVGQLETCVSMLPACASLTQATSTQACAILSGC